MESLRHAVDLAANTIHWALREKRDALAEAHTGAGTHLRAAQVQLDAAQKLLPPRAEEH